MNMKKPPTVNLTYGQSHESTKICVLCHRLKYSVDAPCQHQQKCTTRGAVALPREHASLMWDQSHSKRVGFWERNTDIEFHWDWKGPTSEKSHCRCNINTFHCIYWVGKGRKSTSLSLSIDVCNTIRCFPLILIKHAHLNHLLHPGKDMTPVKHSKPMCHVHAPTRVSRMETNSYTHT